MSAQLGLFSRAAFGHDRRFRLRLGREGDHSRPRVCFVMLNPSSADEHNDDPTITRCMSFARRWGGGALLVANLWAYRATEPRELETWLDSLDGHEDWHSHDEAIVSAARMSHLVVAAWGAHRLVRRVHPRRGGLTREQHVSSLLAKHLRLVECLGLTKGGHPRHPLYVRADVERSVYWGRP